MVEGTPPGDALPPVRQRATPARKGARCGAGAGSPRPHRPHPGHTGRGTLAARSRGRAARRGTAPDTRHPSQRWQATPPGDGPPPPSRHAAPTGHTGQGDSVGPTHPQTRAHSTWVADPNSPPNGRAVGGGTAPDLRRPSQRRTAPPPGTPFRHPHSEQRRPARGHAVGLVLCPHTRTDRTRDTRVAEPWLAAPEDGRPGEGQRLTPDGPHNGGGPPPPETAAHHSRGTQSSQGMQAKGMVLGPHTHTPAPTARGWRTATTRPMDGQSGGGQRLTSDAPHHGGRRPPPGDALPPPPQRATPARKGARCGAAAGPPRPHRPRPGHVGHGTLAAHSRGLAAGRGTAPNTRRPSQCWKAPPRGRPSATPTTSNAPTHQRTSHGTSAPHPLLLGTAPQQWRNPRPHAKHAPDLQRWTKHTRSSGRWDSETVKGTPHKGTRARTLTWRQYRSPPREARPRNLRRRWAACPRSARRGNEATAPAKAGAPNSTPSPAPMTERCPR